MQHTGKPTSKRHPISATCCDVPALIPQTAPHTRSISTSSPSTRTGNTSTVACSGGSVIPVRKSNAQECHGQTTALPSIQPSLSGPCRCGQMLSTAARAPPTRAKQIVTPSASASITFPSAGASLRLHTRTQRPTCQLQSARSLKQLDYPTSRAVRRRMHARQRRSRPCRHAHSRHCALKQPSSLRRSTRSGCSGLSVWSSPSPF